MAMKRTYNMPGRDMRLAELAGWRRLAASRDRRLSETGTRADGCPADRDPAIREGRVTAAIARIAREEAKSASKGNRTAGKAANPSRPRVRGCAARLKRQKASRE